MRVLSRNAVELWREAVRLGAAGPWWNPLPPLFFVTDPVRTPDPVSVARQLPAGCGVLYRAFENPDAVKIGSALAEVAAHQGLILLVGADEALAERIGAHGMHLPERALSAGRAIRRRHRDWIVTGAAHSARAVSLAGRAGLDAALLSPAFESRSSSAGRPLGPHRLAAMARNAALPVYALGGVNARTVRRLSGTGVSGVAAVEGLTGR